tara:strand:+ start:2029 stop:2664 length:636 start_codon:yes stop_codon:yes gene_type:complete
MSLKKKTNLFALLQDSNDEPPETNSWRRKAQKKLREIEKLKKKSNKTPEEYKKISEESDWQAIAFPTDLSSPESIEDTYKRKEKQHGKTLNEYERKFALQTKQINDLKKELQTAKYQQKMIESEQIEKDKIIQKQHFIIYKLQQQSCSIESIIQDEYKQKCDDDSTLSQEKVWHKMMRKYHPDKISKHLGFPLANELATFVTKLKPSMVDE